jgi:protein dithiol oxidoreductase (disulfide-forming)
LRWNGYWYIDMMATYFPLTHLEVTVLTNIKHLGILLFGILFLVACQQEDTETKSTDKVEKNSPSSAASEINKTEDTSNESPQAEHHGHSHEPANILPGAKYQIVEPQATCEKPVVIEFFAYHCPHCNDLEPAAAAWRKKNEGKVEFISVPTHLGHEQLGVMLLVHHAAKKLDVLENTQHALFKRFHEEKKLFASEEEVAQFLAAQGADLEKARIVLKDQAAISESIKPDFELLNKYKISSVPQVLVNHKYMTNITIAGGHKEVFEVVDDVLKLENSCGK